MLRARAQIIGATWIVAFAVGAVLLFAITPASASASELSAGQGAQGVRVQDYQVVSSPSAPKVDSFLATGAGKLTAHVTTVNYAQGYQFQIAKNSKFTKGVKTKKVRSATAKFTGLAKGKKYYVRVRAYQSATNLCTKWSKKKSATSGIDYKKSKFIGKWKAVSSNDAEINYAIKYFENSNTGLGVYSTFAKNGTLTIDAAGSSKSTFKYAVTSKTKGHEISGGYIKASTLSISGNKLTLKGTSAGSSAGTTITFVRA